MLWKLVFIEETLSTHLSKRLVLENYGCFPKFEQSGSKIDIAQRTSKSENLVFIEETLSGHFAKKRLFFPENSVFIEETLSGHFANLLFEPFFNTMNWCIKIEKVVLIEETFSKHFAKNRANFHSKCSIHRRNIFQSLRKIIGVEKLINEKAPPLLERKGSFVKRL